MDYKEKYEMALETIQEILDGGSDSIKMSRLRLRLQSVFPELKESEDEKIKKELIKHLKEGVEGYMPAGDSSDYQRWLAWLEKQCEQKVNYTTFVETGNGGINALVTRELSNNDYEEKPANKVEPKYHESDWITNGEYTWKVLDVKSFVYILQSQDGNIVDDSISHVDEQFHSFTIKDAKDGDVLVVPPIKGSEHSEQIFIFKEIKDREYVKNAVEYYCRCMDNEFASNERGFMGQSDDYFTPATKEQRELLFQKMREAGYEWDSEKKELKEIEQKPAWSDEDERNMQSIDSVLFYDKKLPEDICVKLRNFLKSLKDRVFCEEKFTTMWKPSEEQMKALDEALSLAKNCGEESAFDLRTLHEQLKEL